jgi:hypothetical protein
LTPEAWIEFAIMGRDPCVTAPVREILLNWPREAVVAKSLKFKIAQLRHLIEQAEKSKLEARSLHVSAEYYKGRISALHDAIEILER